MKKLQEEHEKKLQNIRKSTQAMSSVASAYGNAYIQAKLYDHLQQIANRKSDPKIQMHVEESLRGWQDDGLNPQQVVEKVLRVSLQRFPYYSVLGVDTTATSAEITAAYKKVQDLSNHQLNSTSTACLGVAS